MFVFKQLLTFLNVCCWIQLDFLLCFFGNFKQYRVHCKLWQNTDSIVLIMTQDLVMKFQLGNNEKWKQIAKVAGVKVYPRWNQNNRAHAVTACIGLWCHKLMLHLTGLCMHAMPHYVTGSYCMGSAVLILSQIYLYLQLLCK